MSQCRGIGRLAHLTASTGYRPSVCQWTLAMCCTFNSISDSYYLHRMVYIKWKCSVIQSAVCHSEKKKTINSTFLCFYHLVTRTTTTPVIKSRPWSACHSTVKPSYHQGRSIQSPGVSVWKQARWNFILPYKLLSGVTKKFSTSCLIVSTLLLLHS